MSSLAPDSDDLRRLLAARRDIDQALLEKHSVEMAVLFTDIVGSTRYFEEKGDIEGLARVHKHNELLFPLVAAHGGRIIKTIGDAIMAVFPEPARGVDCAAAMQRRLRDAQRDEEDPIRIRVGVHAGRVMIDGEDVFGDTVNTAARVANAAEGDEVLLSRALADALPPDGGHRVAPRGELSFKGKAEPFPVVALLWDGASSATADPSSAELFVLELGLEDQGLRVAVVDGAKEKQTVKAYAVQPVTRAALDEAARTLSTLAHGGGERGYVEPVKALGRELFEKALSERARTRLSETDLSFLRLHLDDSLVQVPWELLFDGEAFLGLRFATGRVVAARGDGPPPKRARREGSAVVIANPTGDLPSASREGRAVEQLLRDAGLADVVLLDGARPKEEVLEALREARLVHFAGHTRQDEEGNAGLALEGGVLSAHELADALAEHPPELVFVNGCRAQAHDGWSPAGGSSLAPALLLRGVEHYLAPAFEISDDDALFFALRFYEAALFGTPYGEAARDARRALVEGGARPLSFAGYALYGEPRATFSSARSRGPRAKLRSTSLEALPMLGLPTPSARAQKASNETASEPSSEDRSEPSTPADITPAVHARTAFGLTFGTMGLAATIGIVITAVGLYIRGPRHPPPPKPSDPPPPVASAEPSAAPDAPKPPAKPEAPAPVRVSVLPFKDLSDAEDLAYLREGLAEVVVTDFGSVMGVQLIERGQIDVDIAEIEFSQSKYVDPETRATLGKIAGAEVVVLGSYQRAAGKLRANARFVQVETGEILSAVRVEHPENDVFELQDELAKRVREAVRGVRGQLRP